MRGNALAAAVVALTMALTGPWAHASMQRLAMSTTGPPRPDDPLAGRAFAWTLTVPPIEGMTCRETWRFDTDGTVTFQSNAEVTTHAYSLYRDPATGVILMTRRRLTSNGAPDCTGASDPAIGHVRETILRFEGEAGFLTCTDVTADTCFGKAVAVAGQMALK
ncbi:MAG: hypothetical protein MUF14_09120 [Hyphomonadaceae bacterium]|jgi:hypothetical protein|nr:hypothetical protein [Hyphomonadaceae bacterium]